MSRTRSRSARPADAGFTLLEIVFAVVVLAVLVRVAVPRVAAPATLTLPTQTQAVADLLRRAQALAIARGQRISVSVQATGANGRIAIACATGSTPCNTDTTLTLAQGVVVGSLTAFHFNTLGQPVDSSTGLPLTTSPSLALSYTGSGSTVARTVTVATLTGRVSVSP